MLVPVVQLFVTDERGTRPAQLRNIFDYLLYYVIYTLYKLIYTQVGLDAGAKKEAGLEGGRRHQPPLPASPLSTMSFIIPKGERPSQLFL